MMFLASLLMLQSPAMAEPVLVPALTGTPEVSAERVQEFYEVLVAELIRSGFEVVDADALMAIAGDDVENCAASAACVPKLFSSAPAPIAVVGAVGVAGDRERITLRFYIPRERSPAKVFQVDIREGETWTNAERVSVLIDALLTLVDSEYLAPEPVASQPVVLLDDQGQPIPMPPTQSQQNDVSEVDEFLENEEAVAMESAAPEAKEPVNAPAPVTKPETAVERAEREAAEREEMGLDNLTYRIYRRSGIEQRRWLQTRKPRVGRGSIEISGGLASGDVHRQYDVRVALAQDGFQELGRYESDIVRADNATHINFALGYNIGQWWELSFQAGIQATQKSMTSGWEMYDSANTSSELLETDAHDHGSVAAYQGVISPRARFFALPVGPVKLYAMGGLKLVIMDGFHVPDLNVVNYPDKPSRTLFGASGGGGLMVDPQDYLGIFAEVDMVSWLVDSDRDLSSTGQAPRFHPGVPNQVGFLVRPTVGLQYRF